MAQLVWLLGAVAVAALPHATSVAPWVLAALLLAGLWRLLASARRWRLPGRWSRIGLTLGATFAVTLSYRRISGVDAGSALLIVMLALKLLETRSARDRGVVVLIAWFLLFAGFLREQALWSAAQLFAGVIFGTLALLQSARRGTPLAPLPAGAHVLRTAVLALPLALALFLLFPRIPSPFWALPTGAAGGRSGLTDEISPGDISSLALSDEVAFRVRFFGPVPEPAQLYWRGPVLDRFDGRRWRASSITPREAPAAPRQRPGTTTFEYESVLEPSGQRWLLPLETPLEWSVPGATLSASLELRSLMPLDQRAAWRGRSQPTGEMRAPRAPDAADEFLPASSNPRTRALAAQLRRDTGSAEAFLASALRLFREQPFFYTLQPPPLGTDPVDAFLFETRSGFCEHYASAFAVLARAAGLPARVVAGYQGGERNPFGDYWIVRQSDAHAWTEVWLEGRWVRFDPTAAVAPERIELGLDAATGRTAADLPLLGSGSLAERLALSWDAANAAWDRWVLAFGPDAQMALMRQAGLRQPLARDLVWALAITMGLLMGGLTLGFLWLGHRRRDPIAAAWARFCRRLGRVTRPRELAEGPSEYSEAAAALRPDLGPAIRGITGMYVRLRYEGGLTPEGARRFRSAVSDFRPSVARPHG